MEGTDTSVSVSPMIPNFIPKHFETKGIPLKKDNVIVSLYVPGKRFVYVLTETGPVICNSRKRLDFKERNSFTEYFTTIHNKFTTIEQDIVVYGMLVGPGVLKNKLKLDDLDAYVYDIHNINTNSWYTFDDLEVFCQTHQIKHTPTIYQGPFGEFDWDLAQDIYKTYPDSNKVIVSTEPGFLSHLSDGDYRRQRDFYVIDKDVC